METFEFLVTSTVQATLYEHIKIQALNYEDAVTRIEDRDYYEEDGEILQLSGYAEERYYSCYKM